MSQLSYIVKRSFYTIILLWVILTFLFFLFRLMPGSYIDLMVQEGANPEAVERVEQRWGLDQPLYMQYWTHLVNFAQFDVGISRQFNEPVWDVVRPRIFNSLILIVPALTTGYIISAIAGTFMGSKRGSRFEQYSIVGVIGIGAFPGWFTAIVVIIVFAVWLGWFPTGGILSTDVASYYARGDFAWWERYLTTNFLWHYILPFGVIVSRYLMGPALVMRTSVVEVQGQDFGYYQKIAGLTYRTRMKHLGKHAILPLITLYPISVANAISGLVIIELVFNWPGIGFTLINGVYARDTPMVLFVFFLVAAFVVIANFIVDIMYGVIDPRVSVGDR